MTKEVVPPPMEAWFEARAWDAEGKVVPGVVVGWIAFPSAQYFCEELLGCGEEDEAGIMGFATISLPGTSGVERVALLSHGELVDERAAGAQAPVFESVTMTEVSDGMLVEWVAFDPDGDPLEYRFEVRGRATTVVRWPPSFGGLSMTESSMVLDPSWFDCSGACRLVVVASDGINTAWATVDPVEVTAPSP